MSQPSLRPQDVVVLAKLISRGAPRPAYAELARELAMSSSEVHASLRRLIDARLMSSDPTGARPLADAIEKFLIHGVRYAFPPKRGPVARGMATGYAAPPLKAEILPGAEPPPVWPDPSGDVRGVTLEPLYRTVPVAARQDAALYELLALIDAIRDGRARERQLAERYLHDRIHGAHSERSQSRAPRTRR